MKIIKVYRVLNYFEYFPIFISTANTCLSNSAFASLIGVPLGIASSAVGLKICVTTKKINSISLLSKKEEKTW